MQHLDEEPESIFKWPELFQNWHEYMNILCTIQLTPDNSQNYLACSGTFTANLVPSYNLPEALIYSLGIYYSTGRYCTVDLLHDPLITHVYTCEHTSLYGARVRPQNGELWLASYGSVFSCTDPRDGPGEMDRSEYFMQKVAVVHVGLWVCYFDWTWRELQEYTTEIHVVASILQNHCKIHQRSVVKPGIILLVARQRRRDSPSEIFHSSLGSSPENNSWKERVNLGRWKCYQSRKWARVIF